MRTCAKCPKRTNVILDLDNTIISSLAKHEEDVVLKPRMKHFRYEKMEDVYTVFERPGLQTFLDFLFQNFNVSVWTAASKSYALFIIDKFIINNRPERKLVHIFFSYHCKQSKRLDNKQKSLRLLKDSFNLPNYDMDRTVIIDDHPEVYKTQPNNCIHIKPFEFTERKSYTDSELDNYVRPKLEDMLRKQITFPQKPNKSITSTINKQPVVGIMSAEQNISRLQ